MTTLTQMVAATAAKETVFNENLYAVSPAGLFAYNYSTSTGLTFGYYGGQLLINGVITSISNGTVTLTNAATNYVEATSAGTVSANTTAFTAGRIPLYTAVTSGSVVTSKTDYRAFAWPQEVSQKLVKAMADANQTLTAAEARCTIIETTGALTALRDVIVPLSTPTLTVFANVTGGFGVRVIGATGTGITIADGKRAIVYGDGTNVVRVTADT